MYVVLTSSSGSDTLLFLYGFKESFCWTVFLGGAILNIQIMVCGSFSKGCERVRGRYQAAVAVREDPS